MTSTTPKNGDLITSKNSRYDFDLIQWTSQVGSFHVKYDYVTDFNLSLFVSVTTKNWVMLISTRHGVVFIPMNTFETYFVRIER